MEEILSINRPVVFDESVAHCEDRKHLPITSPPYGNNNEIRIVVQNQDVYALISKSKIHITGKITKNDGGALARTELVNLGINHLFEKIVYQLNGVPIDECKNVGITTLMKTYLSKSPNHTPQMYNAGWMVNEEGLTSDDGKFDIYLPLCMLLGFAEDYRQIVVNARHELILIRSTTDNNAVIQVAYENAVEPYEIGIENIEWHVPYITVADNKKIALLNYISKDPVISVSFRDWELYEYPLLPATNKHIWTVKTFTQLEKPRYVIVGFQTARKNDALKNASEFDHCNIRNVKLFLNSQSYPYGNLDLDITNNKYAVLYDTYVNFQPSYYRKEPEPLLSRKEFRDKAPLIVIDCSSQNEFLKSGPVDIHLEFESTAPFPANTTAFCLILHDRIVELFEKVNKFP